MTFAKNRQGVQHNNSWILRVLTLLVMLISAAAQKTAEDKLFDKVRRQCNEFSIKGKQGWTFKYLSKNSLKVVGNLVESVYCQSRNPKVNRNLDRVMSVAPFLARSYSYDVFINDLGNEFLGFKLTWSSPDGNEHVGKNQILVFEHAKERVRIIAFRGSETASDHYINTFQVLPNNEIDIEITNAMFKMLHDAGLLRTEPTKHERVVNPNPWKNRLVGTSKGCQDLLYLLYEKLGRYGIDYEYAVFIGTGTGINYSERARKVFLWALDAPSYASKHVFIQNCHDAIALNLHYLFKCLLKKDSQAHKAYKDKVRENNLIFVDTGKANFQREHFMDTPSGESDGFMMGLGKFLANTQSFFNGTRSYVERLDNSMHKIHSFFQDHDLPMERVWKAEHVVAWVKQVESWGMSKKDGANIYPNPDRKELRKAVDEVREYTQFRPPMGRKRPHTCQCSHVHEPSNRQKTGCTWNSVDSQVPEPQESVEFSDGATTTDAPSDLENDKQPVKPVDKIETTWKPESSITSPPPPKDSMWKPGTAGSVMPPPPNLGGNSVWTPPPPVFSSLRFSGAARRRLKMLLKIARLHRAEEHSG
jgi:hypothetical protein